MKTFILVFCFLFSVTSYARIDLEVANNNSVNCTQEALQTILEILNTSEDEMSQSETEDLVLVETMTEYDDQSGNETSTHFVFDYYKHGKHQSNQYTLQLRYNLTMELKSQDNKIICQQKDKHLILEPEVLQ